MHISLICSEVMNITLFQTYNEFGTISLCVGAAYLGLISLMKLLAALALRFREKHPTISSPGEKMSSAKADGCLIVMKDLTL